MTHDKSEGADWEREFDDKWYNEGFVTYDSDIDADVVKPETIKAFIAQERQQAVAEFAREVVAEVPELPVIPNGGIDDYLSAKTQNRIHRHIRTLAKERGIELDQPINSIFKE